MRPWFFTSCLHELFSLGMVYALNWVSCYFVFALLLTASSLFTPVSMHRDHSWMAAPSVLLSGPAFPHPEQGWSGWLRVMGGGVKGSWGLAGGLICIFFSLLLAITETAPQEHAFFISFAISTGSVCTRPHRFVSALLLGGYSCPCDLKILFEHEMTQLL